jgi:hypothetical protein
MRNGHLPFAVMNASVNRVVRALLRSRWHGLLSRRLLLITVTGRRTGREHTFPVGYTEDDGVIRIGVAAPAQKRWWRNLVDGAPVRLWVRGAERSGRAVAHGDESAGVTVEVRLGAP